MERIWIYTLSKELISDELTELNNRCQNFVSNWTAHEVSLDATFELYKNRLLMFKVNEANYNASGCSIDKQVRFIKELEHHFSVELLNRLLVVCEVNDEVIVFKQNEIKQLLSNNTINENTWVFNNSITKSAELINGWKCSLKETYLSKYLIKK